MATNQGAVAAMASLAGFAGWTGLNPQPARPPVGGPQDLRLYTTLAELDRSDSGAVTDDGRVLVFVSPEQRVTELDLDVLDQLEDLSWIESPSATSYRLTDKGRYWMTKFLKHNRLRLSAV